MTKGFNLSLSDRGHGSTFKGEPFLRDDTSSSLKLFLPVSSTYSTPTSLSSSRRKYRVGGTCLHKIPEACKVSFRSWMYHKSSWLPWRSGLFIGASLPRSRRLFCTLFRHSVPRGRIGVRVPPRTNRWWRDDKVLPWVSVIGHSRRRGSPTFRSLATGLSARCVVILVCPFERLLSWVELFTGSKVVEETRVGGKFPIVGKLRF